LTSSVETGQPRGSVSYSYCGRPLLRFPHGAPPYGHFFRPFLFLVTPLRVSFHLSRIRLPFEGEDLVRLPPSPFFPLALSPPADFRAPLAPGRFIFPSPWLKPTFRLFPSNSLCRLPHFMLRAGDPPFLIWVQEAFFQIWPPCGPVPRPSGFGCFFVLPAVREECISFCSLSEWSVLFETMVPSSRGTFFFFLLLSAPYVDLFRSVFGLCTRDRPLGAAEVTEPFVSDSRAISGRRSESCIFLLS